MTRLTLLYELLPILGIQRFRETEHGFSRNAELLRHFADEGIFLGQVVRNFSGATFKSRHTRRTDGRDRRRAELKVLGEDPGLCEVNRIFDDGKDGEKIVVAGKAPRDRGFVAVGRAGLAK